MPRLASINVSTRHCRRALPLVTIVLAVVTLWPVTALAQQKLDAAAVLGAIDRGVAFLKREQTARGTWGDRVGYDGGVTALCTLALLNSGVDTSDPVLVKALTYLRRLEADKTYSVSLQTMVLATAEPRKDLVKIQKNVEWLEATQNKGGNQTGAWSYPNAGGDPSNSQFAVLALHEAQKAGAKVQPETWRLAASYWRRIQNEDGSWSYNSEPASGSMTCAGIAALQMTSDAISEGDARVVNRAVRCCQKQPEDDALDRAIEWLARNFSVRRNPMPGGDQRWHYYYLYALERVGRLTSRRFIGDHDWYREGAEYLVNAQDPLSHYWRGSRLAENDPQIGTSMALLFLSKGRRPLLMTKVKHGDDDAWNAHRRDAAHLTTFVEQAWDLDLTWQVIEPAKASVEDLLQSPVLYVSGGDLKNLLPQANRLRAYLDRGGFLFAESTCRKTAQQRQAMDQLVAAIFPEPEYRLRDLGPAHPLWRMEQLVRPRSPYYGRLLGVEYGCRTCMVFCEEDLSCYWELDRPTRVTEYPDKVRQRIADANTIGINVLAYATNREPRGKEQAFVDLDPGANLDPSQRRAVIEIAKLRHGGGCNDAPGALANLTRAAADGDTKLQIATDSPLISISDPALFRYHLVFMHGRTDFRLTPKERQQLRKYLERGGIVLADSICASDAFTKAFRREMLAALEGAQIQRVPEDDPLFTTEYGGYDVRQVALRQPLPAGKRQPLVARTRKVAPQLEGIRVNDSWAVLFSPYDLSCALEKHEAIQCQGYTRQDAARLGLNVLLYSLNQ